ncbi:uncharacterized protein F5147DRAFT_774250 [Suillus discolor]|uniref:Uncharacterized protein n=1 Tax=Suillus discolor TaxID=1912936 RepID=A0A9P7F6B7_9AGAM|nr:uncharacterized protein F5147DRAFT_774250 [Suillus discolor]KAG2107419.1 hypothetical protein F5147DRAFT_774250 [Suillus discolor]
MSSSELQYIVELSGQHLLLISNMDNHIPISKRLQELKDKAHAWFSVDIRSAKTFSIPKVVWSNSFVADGHIYMWDKIDDTATIIPIFPKPSQQTIKRNWPPGTLCTVPNSTNLRVLMDPAQNLIAVVYVNHERLFINLRALDDDSFHPQAAGLTLFLSELPGYDDHMDSESLRLKVMGRYIALQCTSSKYNMWQLQIWNWQHSTTSDSVLRVSNKCPWRIHFCFFGNDRLLVFAEDLKLYSIEDMSQTPELLASFMLHTQLRYTTACLLPVDDIACSSQPQWGLNAPIVYVISTRIFLRSFRSGSSDANTVEIVHLSGNRVLLLFPVPERISNHNSVTRRISKLSKLRIMDFSPLAVMNRWGLGRVVRKPSTLDITGCEEHLTTFLPYVEVILDREFGADKLTDIWMDRDKIYLLSNELEVINV